MHTTRAHGWLPCSDRTRPVHLSNHSGGGVAYLGISAIRDLPRNDRKRGR